MPLTPNSNPVPVDFPVERSGAVRDGRHIGILQGEAGFDKKSPEASWFRSPFDLVRRAGVISGNHVAN